MNPDIRVTECCDGECRRRVKANGDGPKQKEGVEVHTVVCESEDAFLNKRHFAISWIEMVNAGRSYESEVSFNTVGGVRAERDEDCGDDGLRENVEL